MSEDIIDPAQFLEALGALAEQSEVVTTAIHKLTTTVEAIDARVATLENHTETLAEQAVIHAADLSESKTGIASVQAALDSISQHLRNTPKVVLTGGKG